MKFMRRVLAGYGIGHALIAIGSTQLRTVIFAPVWAALFAVASALCLAVAARPTSMRLTVYAGALSVTACAARAAALVLSNTVGHQGVGWAGMLVGLGVWSMLGLALGVQFSRGVVPLVAMWRRERR